MLNKFKKVKNFVVEGKNNVVTICLNYFKIELTIKNQKTGGNLL
jgi:hypothetical protein